MKVLLRSYRQTGKMPPALQNKPEAGLIPTFLVESFLLLHSSRQAGMGGPMPLSLADILTAASLYGYSTSPEQYAFLRAMQSLDGFYLTEESARIKATSKNKPK